MPAAYRRDKGLERRFVRVLAAVDRRLGYWDVGCLSCWRGAVRCLCSLPVVRCLCSLAPRSAAMPDAAAPAAGVCMQAGLARPAWRGSPGPQAHLVWPPARSKAHLARSPANERVRACTRRVRVMWSLWAWSVSRAGMHAQECGP
eukprot:1136688-Pelagomonas_calceolata.AAC.8